MRAAIRSGSSKKLRPVLSRLGFAKVISEAAEVSETHQRRMFCTEAALHIQEMERLEGDLYDHFEVPIKVGMLCSGLRRAVEFVRELVPAAQRSLMNQRPTVSFLGTAWK